MTEEGYRRLISILEGLRDLLNDYGYLAHAQVLQQNIDLANLEDPRLATRLRSGGIWSGAGSVADITLGTDEQLGTRELERDVRRFCSLLADLGDEMDRLGMGDADLRARSSLFRRLANEKAP